MTLDAIPCQSIRAVRLKFLYICNLSDHLAGEIRANNDLSMMSRPTPDQGCLVMLPLVLYIISNFLSRP